MWVDESNANGSCCSRLVFVTHYYIYREFVTDLFGFCHTAGSLFGIRHVFSHLRWAFVSLSMGICHSFVGILSRFSLSFVWLSNSYIAVYNIYCFIIIKKKDSFFSFLKEMVVFRGKGVADAIR